MSIKTRKRKNGSWMVDIHTTTMDGTAIRLRRVAPVSSQEAAKKWAQAHERHLALEHGPDCRCLERGRREDEKDEPMTVKKLIAEWLDERKKQGKPSEPDERQRLEHYVVPFIGDVAVDALRPAHVADWIGKLKTRRSRTGGTLGSRTVLHAYTTLKQVFRYAVIRGHVAGDPILVEAGVLPKKMDKDPAWRKTAKFEVSEVEQLISDGRIPDVRRVAYAIEFFTGMRMGEVSALRWRDYYAGEKPLGKLICSTSFDTRTGEVKTTKTGTARELPVHPVLAAILAAWKLHGWAKETGKKPAGGDLILPATVGKGRNVNVANDQWKRDLKELGLRPRRHYDTRRTFISVGIDAGCSKEVLKFLTHPSPADAFDLYRTPSWPALCEQVMKLPFGKREGKVIQLHGADAATGTADGGTPGGTGNVAATEERME